MFGNVKTDPDQTTGSMFGKVKTDPDQTTGPMFGKVKIDPDQTTGPMFGKVKTEPDQTAGPTFGKVKIAPDQTTASKASETTKPSSSVRMLFGKPVKDERKQAGSVLLNFLYSLYSLSYRNNFYNPINRFEKPGWEQATICL